METPRTILTTPLEGGHLALDFVNTTGGARDEPPAPGDEMLTSYDDLVDWSARVRAITAEDAERLRRAAAADPRGAQTAVRSALELRDVVYGVFRALAEGRAPDPEQLAALRDADVRALDGAELTCPGGGASRWVWPAPEELDAPLWPVVHAAVELLTHGPVERVKVCAHCRWLFLDQSRNRSRRWCSMSECGTQVKGQRFVERRRRRRTTEPGAA